MKKFILIDHEPWTLRRKQLFYDLFETAGIPLEVWDLSQMLNPGLHNPDELEEAPYLTKIRTKQEFETLVSLKNNSSTIFIEEVLRIWSNRHVFQQLSNYGFKTIKIEFYGNTKVTQGILSRLKNIKRNEIIPIIKNKITTLKFKLYQRYHKIPPYPTYLLSSNSQSPERICFNHPDYEDISFKENVRLIDNDYIVFSDIFFPYHPDLKYFYKIHNLPDGRKYHKLMRQYFDFLEEKYGMPVIIAAHPKAEYKGDEFGNRRIIKYHTANLIKYCKFVTMHYCNTISFAMITNKPVAYIVTNDYLSIPGTLNKLNSLVVETLGLQYFNIESAQFKETFKFSRVKPDLREKYIYSYITSPKTKNIPNYQTLYNTLMSI